MLSWLMETRRSEVRTTEQENIKAESQKAIFFFFALTWTQQTMRDSKSDTALQIPQSLFRGQWSISHTNSVLHVDMQTRCPAHCRMNLKASFKKRCAGETLSEQTVLCWWSRPVTASLDRLLFLWRCKANWEKPETGPGSLLMKQRGTMYGKNLSLFMFLDQEETGRWCNNLQSQVT